MKDDVRSATGRQAAVVAVEHLQRVKSELSYALQQLKVVRSTGEHRLLMYEVMTLARQVEEETFR